MFFWERRNYIILMILAFGTMMLANRFNAPQPLADAKIDKLANYLYSAPVILKKVRSFLGFSHFPIIDIKAPADFGDTTKEQKLIAANPRGNALPSPSPSPIAKKATQPKDKATDNFAYGNRLTIENYNNETPNNDGFGEPSPAEPTAISGAGGANQTNPKDQKINDWKYKLFMNPTKDNMNAFIQEYQTGRITKDIFYGVLKSLVDDADERAQSIGLYGLTAVPSYESFEILAIKVDEKTLRKENQNLAQKDLDHYASPENVKILLQGLRSANEAVGMQALLSVNQLIEHKQLVNSSQNLNTLSERERRGTASTQMNKESYSEFLNALQNLTQSKNAQVAILAENTLQNFKDSITLRPEYVENDTHNTNTPPSRLR